MSNFIPPRPLHNPRIAVAACMGFLALGLAPFVLSLDRYPSFFRDEPVYNYPAVSFLEGKGFIYEMSPQAPHGRSIWAYHAPFFPRMQIVTFSLFGANEFACRAPDLFFGYLSVLILCILLISHKLTISALALSIGWIGDRASQEVLLGRMDGIALFFLSLGFVALVRLVDAPSLWRGFATGVCLGTAAGFHPAAAVFVVVSFLFLLVKLKSGSRGSAFVGFFMGGMIPLVLCIACWMPDIGGSIEQFRWHLNQAASRGLGESVTSLIKFLGWARYWVFALIMATVFFPLVLSRSSGDENRTSLGGVARLFAFAGLYFLVTKATYPYYLIYFTPWAIMACAVLLESSPRPNKVLSRASLLGLILVCSWLPSLAWNVMRARETFLFRSATDPKIFARKLGEAIPKGARVMVEPELFLISKQAGLDYRLLAWFPQQADVPPDVWLLISEVEWLKPGRVSRASINARRVVLNEGAFPGAGPLDYRFVILAPQQ